MRTYEDIFEEFLTYYYKKTQNEEYNPYRLKSIPEPQLTVYKGKIWKKLMDLVYKQPLGIYFFTKFILGDMTYAGYPEPIRFNSLCLKWSKILREGTHLAILCPRQHGKTTFWTVIQPLYRASCFESYNVLIESASSEQAESILNFITKTIENNEYLASKVSKNAKWSTVELHYNTGKIVAKGVGSEVRGGTYDYIVCDDILRSDNKLSDIEIEHFVDEELEPMILVRNGQIVVVGTPKSYTDIFTVIERRAELGEGWKIFKYKAILDFETQEVLCPDRFTFHKLMLRKSIMGSRKFDKEFMCQVYSSGTALFTEEIRKAAMDRGARYTLYARARPEDDLNLTYYMGVDTARAGTASADFTVAFVIAYNEKTQEKRICYMWREKGMKISEQAKAVAEIAKDFNYPHILVEKNNVGQDFIDELVDNYNLSVEAFSTTKISKEDLIRFLIVQFENEKLIIPTGNKHSRDMMGLLNNELERFVVEITPAGNEIMKGSGTSHDDMVMALALTIKNTQGRFSPFAVTTDKRKSKSDLELFTEKKDDYYWMKL